MKGNKDEPGFIPLALNYMFDKLNDVKLIHIRI